MTMTKTGDAVTANVVEKPKGKPGPKPKAPKPAEETKSEASPPAENGAAPATNGAPVSNAIEQPLTREEAMLAQLGQERILTAQLQLTARQKEFEGSLMGIKARYEGDGRFAMTAIDIPRGVITLVPKA